MRLRELSCNVCGIVKVRDISKNNEYIYVGYAIYLNRHLEDEVLNEKIVMMYPEDNYLDVAI